MGSSHTTAPVWPASRRLIVWVSFVVFCALGMAYTQLPYVKIPFVGTITYFEVLLLPAGLLGIGPLLRIAGARERSGARTMCRIIIAYLAFELLFVVPVAGWIGTAKTTAVLSELAVRFTWVLFPVVLVLCTDDRVRRRASFVVIAAGVCLVLWGVYTAAAGGGGGYYLEGEDLRYRILYGGSLMLFAWPLVVALSGDVRRRSTLALLAIPLAGLLLTNMRSGYIACAVAAVACLVLSKQVRRVVPWIVPVALVAVVVGLLWGQQAGSAFGYTMSHLFDLGSSTGADRVARDVLAWNYFAKYPFSDYVWTWRYYLVYLQNPYGPHNFVANIAVTEGVAGLVFYASILVVALRHTWSWVWKDVEVRMLVCYLLLYLVFQSANSGFYAPVNIALFIAAVAALVARIDRLRREKASGGLAAAVSEGSRGPVDVHEGLLPQGSAPKGGDPS